jgi:hypothetical protein
VINGGAAYTEASARITATEVLTLPFIWTFQSRTAGRIARDQSVRISIALKKNETLLRPRASRLACLRVVSKGSELHCQGGLQMLAMPATKTIAAMHVNPMMA